MEKQYIVAEVLEKNRVCHRCRCEFELGSIKIGKFENRRWDNFHPRCFWLHPDHKGVTQNDMMCHTSLSDDQQHELEELRKVCFQPAVKMEKQSPLGY